MNQTNGPCATCGVVFKSRDPKRKFCTMACYVASPRFKEVQAIASKKAAAATKKRPRTGAVSSCLECKQEFPCKPSEARAGKKRYCSTACSRKHMAARFDRWVANPQEIALPQCFDEFLTLGLLPCLVVGCEWRGHLLSNHMNQTHGVTARQFKALAGFNRGTGVVSLTAHLALAARECFPVGHSMQSVRKSLPSTSYNKGRVLTLEALEHHRKIRALLRGTPSGITRVCVGCGAEFEQSTPFGRAKFHSKPCRSQFYYKQQKATE